MIFPYPLVDQDPTSTSSISEKSFYGFYDQKQWKKEAAEKPEEEKKKLSFPRIRITICVWTKLFHWSLVNFYEYTLYIYYIFWLKLFYNFDDDIIVT